MQKWHLSFLISILLLFHLKVIRIKKLGRRIWIGKNKKLIFQNSIPYSVRASAKRSIAKEMPLRVRYRWWRREHPRLVKYGVRLAISIIFVCLGMPVLFGAEVIIDNDNTYAGFVDYDPHIFSNSNGDFVVIYNPQSPNDRISTKYSTDTGATWSSRTILFSNDGQLDGIIDDDIGGYWEMSGEVYDDVLYFACEIRWGATVTATFTKCDISDITNIETFSNWKSANSVSVPSEGNGDVGAGYDVFLAPRRFDPSLTVRNDDDIIVALINSAGDPKELYIHHWTGAAWGSGFKLFPEDVFSVPSLRKMRGNDLVCGCGLAGGDGNDYMVIVRCDNSADPTIASNWTKMDGSAGFDYVIDTGVGAFAWPHVVVDSNNYVHIVSATMYTIEIPPPAIAYRRVYHNWHNGTSWQEGDSENSAGAMVIGELLGIAEPRLFQSSRSLGLNADAGGNVFMIFTTWGGPTGDGVYSMIWKSGTQVWDYTTYTQESNIKRIVCSANHQCGDLTISPFAITTTTGDAIYFIGVANALPGSPWWEAVPKPAGGGSNCRLILPLELHD